MLFFPAPDVIKNAERVVDVCVLPVNPLSTSC